MSGWIFCSLGRLACAQADVPAQKMQFAIGEASGEPAAAVVTVKGVVAAPKKRSLLPKSILSKGKEAESVLQEVSVRFEKLRLGVLHELPGSLRLKTQVQRLQIRRLALYAPGDSVPRLMAEEAQEQGSGEWLLKKVLFVDRPAAKECRLILKEGEEPGLVISKGKVLALNSLMTSSEGEASR